MFNVTPSAAEHAFVAEPFRINEPEPGKRETNDTLLQERKKKTHVDLVYSISELRTRKSLTRVLD